MGSNFKARKKSKTKGQIYFGNGELKAEVLEIVEEGNRLVRFEYEGVFEEVLDRVGIVPLPPYITKNLMIQKGIRQFIQGIKVLLQLQLQDFTLQKNF